MKKTILVLLLVFLSVFTVTNALNIPIEKNVPSTSTTRQRAPMLIPVVVDLSATDLYLNFTNSVGVAIITITDEMGTIQYQETMDTNSTSDLYIPIDMWDSGNYTLTIEYGSITLNGTFEL